MSRKVGSYSDSHSRKLTRKYLAKQDDDEARPAKVPRLQDAADDPLALDPLMIDPVSIDADLPINDHPNDQDMQIDALLIDEEEENSSDGDQIELPVVDDEDSFSDVSADEEEDNELDTTAV